MPVLKINNGKLYVDFIKKDAGLDTIVFLNPIAHSENIWKETADFFVTQNYNVLLHDYRGQLKSEKNPPYTFEDNVSDLKAILDYYGITNVHLIGTSYGGIVAQLFTIKFPMHVKTLNLFNTVINPDYKLRLYFDSQISALSNSNVETKKSLYLRGIFDCYTENFIKENVDYIYNNANIIDNLPDDYFNSLLELFKNVNKSKHIDINDLKKIKCPVLVVWCEDDNISLRKNAVQLNSYIEHSEFVIIPNAGHSVYIENPEILKTIFLGFMKKHA